MSEPSTNIWFLATPEDDPSDIMERCEQTWNACYPDRKPWSQIGQEAQDEWVKVFTHFESLR